MKLNNQHTATKREQPTHAKQMRTTNTQQVKRNKIPTKFKQLESRNTKLERPIHKVGRLKMADPRPTPTNKEQKPKEERKKTDCPCRAKREMKSKSDGKRDSNIPPTGMPRGNQPSQSERKN